MLESGSIVGRKQPTEPCSESVLQRRVSGNPPVPRRDEASSNDISDSSFCALEGQKPFIMTLLGENGCVCVHARVCTHTCTDTFTTVAFELRDLLELLETNFILLIRRDLLIPC